jgi:23S rRNA pseudouridine1911/1915/1917 synthase
MAKDFPRQALHARLLAFDHPVSGRHMRFETPFPADMTALVEAFRGWSAATRPPKR